jgi:hypothetical protein
MKKIELSEASQPLSAYTEDFNHETIVLTLHGKVIAVAVSVQDIDPESLSLNMNPEFLSIIPKSRDEFQADKKLSLDKIKQEFL